ncbi:MAG: hypothetical protein KKD28_03620 [Chloroflexi bacterium]|nr:hypothetical protein [Chloroflexota bacterium]
MMSIYTGIPTRNPNLAALLMMNFLGARDPEDAQSITIGGLSDLPPVYPGTIDQHSQDRYIYFSDLREDLVDKSTSTGTSIVTEDVKIVRFPVFFESEIIDHEMIQLERAAESGDERAFIEVAKNINWENRSPENYLRGIQFAFGAGAHMYARRLATEGAEKYPEHQELQKYARILAPPKIIQSNLPPDPTLRESREWLKAHAYKYRGQWLALKNGELLGVAATLRELRNRVGRRDDILFTKGF